MEKVLNIIIPTGASTNDTIAVSDFTYTATRMGKAPAISVQFKHPTFFQNWYSTPYVDFNNRRFYMKGTPSSSYSNEEIVYKYDAVFVADDSLERTYFIDAVHEGDQSYCSNNSKVQFWGNLSDFVARLNAVLGKVGLADKYWACIDSGTVTFSNYPKAFDESLISFEDKYIYDVLTDDCYNAYGVPFFLDGEYAEHSGRPEGFTGTVICFSEKNGEISTPFEYGVNKHLLSISKENANAEIVRRCSGYGSSDNLPWYYPNESATGRHVFRYFAGGSSYYTETLSNGVTIEQIIYDILDRYCDLSGDVQITVQQADSFVYGVSPYEPRSVLTMSVGTTNNTTSSSSSSVTGSWKVVGKKGQMLTFSSAYTFYGLPGKSVPFVIGHTIIADGITTKAYSLQSISLKIDGVAVLNVDDYIARQYGENDNQSEYKYVLTTPSDGIAHQYTLEFNYSPLRARLTRDDLQVTVSTFITLIAAYTAVPSLEIVSLRDLSHPYTNIVPISESGIQFSDVSGLVSGDQIRIAVVEGSWVQPQPRLMPKVFRDSRWMERFYNALNSTYKKPDAAEPLEPSDYYSFDNPYTGEERGEHIEVFDDIKPSIKGMVNESNLPIDRFEAIAFDDNDYDQFTYTENNEKDYIHPYFYVKLRIFNGANGFNLFDHAIDSETMKISITSGVCGGCTFEIMVDEKTKKNVVAVDENGNLIRNEDGSVKIWNSAADIQERQNDTSSYSVWVALKKDIDTYGTIMPSIRDGYLITTSDTFVITGISLPQAYILAAEKRLEDAIIEYMAKNNSEKFKFSIDFSRIYFEESAGSQVLPQLKEGTKISIKYPLGASSNITTYVTGITYQMSNDSHLPKVSVDLADEIIVPKTFQKQIRTDVAAVVEQNNDDLTRKARRAQGQQANPAGSITLDMLDSSVVAMLTGMSGEGHGSMNFAEMTSFPYNGVCGLYNLYSETDTYVKGVLSIDRRDENGQTILFMKVVGMVAMDNGSVVPSSDGYIRSFVRKFFNGSWGGWALESEVSNDTSSAGDIKFGRNIQVNGGKIIIGSAGGKFLELVNIAGEGETPSYALHTNAPFYSDSWVASGGVGGDSGGGGATSLSELSDVDTSGASSGDTLIFDEQSQKWLAQSPQEVEGDKNYVHIQMQASDTWEVVHNLGKYPSVTVVSDSGNTVVGDVVYTGLNSLTITFNAVFSGRAYMN